MMKRAYIYILILTALFCSCQDKETVVSDSIEGGLEIHIGGVTLSDELITDVSYGATRAVTEVDAETQEWLIGPLKRGLDITYGLPNDRSTHKVAILKLTNETGTGIEQVGTGENQYAVDKDSKWAIYSFKYRDPADGDNAVWYGNGAHFFEGVYVPNEIRYGQGVDDASRGEKGSVNSISAQNILTDQHIAGESDGVTGNYTLLERYLGMPANTRRSATVARIKLPFSHRLARVLAYVLIDPTMGSDVKLEGYKKSTTDNKTDVDYEDPTNTSLTFCNVDVLEGVLDEKSDGNDHHTLTPQWKNVRKIVPHFVGESTSQNSKLETVDANDFIVYFNTSTDAYIFPTDDDKWTAAKNAYEAAYNGATGTDAEKAAQATASSHYRQIKYGKVPVYDIILRPTYTSVDNVMYDEAGVKNSDGTDNTTQKIYYYDLTNNIDFELTLNNGLQYYKKVSIDLDANRQTVIYLRLNRESVDYNSSGSELWVSETKEDDWYGVDNEGGHSLSDAGSSWQRAYTVGEAMDDDKVTDGGYYNEATSTDVHTKGQYLKDDDTWIEYFSQACEGGAHHGDYFVLKKDITINAAQLPVGFVFTGHLDAQDHNITVTGTNSWAECTNEVFTILKQKDDGGNYVDIPQLYYFREEAQAHPRSNASTRSIDRGYPILVEMGKITPADVEDYTLYTYNSGTGDYEVYSNRHFYKQTGSALFCGLNGIYTTKQETEEVAGRPIYNQGWEWEANVHKNNNVWVPYRDITDDDAANHTGWRAEIINLKVKGNLFEPDAPVSGNVQNCYQGTNGNIKVKDHLPAIPKYN